MIIDAHVHVFPRLGAGSGDQDGGDPVADHPNGCLGWHRLKTHVPGLAVSAPTRLLAHDRREDGCYTSATPTIMLHRLAPIPQILSPIRGYRRNSWIPGFAVLLFTLLAPLSAASGPQPPEGFTAIFDGQTLTGWKGLVENPIKRAAMSPRELAEAQKEADQRMRAHWRVADGVLEFDGKGDNLCTDKDYGDFELYVDWKILEGGDSGIYLRGSPQIQIWDTKFEKYFRHGAEKGSGALWNNKIHPRFPLVNADLPVGQWNTFYIKMVGDRVTVKLNGNIGHRPGGDGEYLGPVPADRPSRADRTAEPWQPALVSQHLRS